MALFCSTLHIDTKCLTQLSLLSELTPPFNGCLSYLWRPSFSVVVVVVKKTSSRSQRRSRQRRRRSRIRRRLEMHGFCFGHSGRRRQRRRRRNSASDEAVSAQSSSAQSTTVAESSRLPIEVLKRQKSVRRKVSQRTEGILNKLLIKSHSTDFLYLLISVLQQSRTVKFRPKSNFFRAW